jgi:hypothetical protein
MARCSCTTPDTGTNCTCLIEGSANITVEGSGQIGDPYVISAPLALISTEVYTSNGTWDPATFPDAKTLHVRVVAGGGGSASTGATIAGQGVARGGGASGGYSESWLDAATVIGVQTVTVGAGGAAGSPAGTATAGGAGGDSSFGSLVVALGGGGSAATPAPGAVPIVSGGGTPGALGTGDIRVQGSQGDSGFLFAVGARFGGVGGLAPGGLGKPGRMTVTAAVGAVGQLYGGGGSGSVSDGAAAGQLGAAGAPGIVIVEVFG